MFLEKTAKDHFFTSSLAEICSFDHNESKTDKRKDISGLQNKQTNKQTRPQWEKATIDADVYV